MPDSAADWNPGTPAWMTAASRGGGVPPVGAGPSGGVPNYNPGAVITGQLPYVPGINQSSLNYLSQGVPGFTGLSQTESGNIASLLNPSDFTDVSRTGAEQALAGGYSGSGFGAMNTARLTQDEMIRRQTLGSQLLSGAVARLPKPFDPTNLLYHSRQANGGGSGEVFRPGMPALPQRTPVTSPGDAGATGMYGQSKPSDTLGDIMKSYGLTPDTSSGVPLYKMASDPGSVNPPENFDFENEYNNYGDISSGDGYSDTAQADARDPALFDWEN